MKELKALVIFGVIFCVCIVGLTIETSGQFNQEPMEDPIIIGPIPADTLEPPVPFPWVWPQEVYDTCAFGYPSGIACVQSYSRSIFLTVRNMSPVGDLVWEVEPNDFFDVVPNSGSLGPFESQGITAYWDCPSSAGSYAGFICFESNKGACTVYVFIEVIEIDPGDGDPFNHESVPGEIVESEIAVFGNFPNPFNPETEIRFHIPEDCDVTLEVFNVLGQRVTSLIDDYLTAGEHTVTWNMSVSEIGALPSGVYFYRLRAGDATVVEKMLLMK